MAELAERVCEKLQLQNVAQDAHLQLGLELARVECRKAYIARLWWVHRGLLGDQIGARGWRGQETGRRISSNGHNRPKNQYQVFTNCSWKEEEFEQHQKQAILEIEFRRAFKKPQVRV